MVDFSNPLFATIIAESFRFVGEYYKSRPITIKYEGQPLPSQKQIDEAIEVGTEKTADMAEQATQVATGCVACAVNHFSTVSGLLSEATRFGRDDGFQSNEVIDRIGMCLQELNALERVDLRPELMESLPEWEKPLALEALSVSRSVRHLLESLDSTESLDKAAAKVGLMRTTLWRDWVKLRMRHLSPEEQAQIQGKLLNKISEMVDQGELQVEA